MARLVIGCGTGRCGTTSLAILLNKQHNTWASHEFMWLPWNGSKYVLYCSLVHMVTAINAEELNIPKSFLEDLLYDTYHEIFNKELYHKLFADMEQDIIADVSYFWLNYLEWLIELFPDIKIICLERDKEGMTKSWMDYSQHRFGMPFLNWGDMPRLRAIEEYWEYYHKKIRALKSGYPWNIRIYNYKDVLSNFEWQHDMLDFIGIQDKVMDFNVHYSKTGGVPSLQIV